MLPSHLDQVVKGAPPPNVSSEQVAAAAAEPTPEESGRSPTAGTAPIPQRTSSRNALRELQDTKRPFADYPKHAVGNGPGDPLANIPSSPPQIYLNLLILEASLRSQYLHLRARRRQHLFFLTLLTAWTAYFSYHLFLRPREDGQGHGGSPYWLIDTSIKLCFMGGVLTGILIWATGQWERGVRWPRRWVAVTNRGLRGMNCKIVILRGSFWYTLASYAGVLFPYESFRASQGSRFRWIDAPPASPGVAIAADSKHLNQTTPRYAYRDGYATRLSRLEDVSPGGDHLKLLLLPKSFSPEFRANWETYRTEYWERENSRRMVLRREVATRRREHVRATGGWLWWLPGRGVRAERRHATEGDLEGMHRHRAGSQVGEKERERQRHRDSVSTRKRWSAIERGGLGSGSLAPGDAHSHSRSSSRSSATPDPAEDTLGRVTERRTRRGRPSSMRESVAGDIVPKKEKEGNKMRSHRSGAAGRPGSSGSERDGGDTAV